LTKSCFYSCPPQDASRARKISDASLGLASLSGTILLSRFALHAHVSPWRTFFFDWSKAADVGTGLLAFTCYVVMYSEAVPGLHRWTDHSPYDWAFLPELLLALRLCWVTPYTKRFLPLFLRIAPILWWMTILIFLAMCFFSVLGTELFAV